MESILKKKKLHSPNECVKQFSLFEFEKDQASSQVNYPFVLKAIKGVPLVKIYVFLKTRMMAFGDGFPRGQG